MWGSLTGRRGKLERPKGQFSARVGNLFQKNEDDQRRTAPFSRRR